MRINIEDYFEEATNGQFIINGKWYTPLFGCDTIQHLLDELSSQLEAQVSNTNSGSREDKIMELLQDFWNDYNNNKAVVWLRNDETKQLAIYTRGEYADELIQFISRLSC